MRFRSCGAACSGGEDARVRGECPSGSNGSSGSLRYDATSTWAFGGGEEECS